MYQRMFKAAAAAALVAGLAAGPAAARELIRVATAKAAGAATIFMAKERGYFADEGIDVQWTFFDNQQSLAASVISGSEDIAASGIPAGFFNIATKNHLKLIAGSGAEKPGFRSATFVATPDAYAAGETAPKDMLTKKIALSTLGSAHQYALILLAQKYGIDPKALHLIPMQGNGNIVAALTNHAVDAAIMSSVPAATAEANGYGKIIGYAGDETPYNGISFYTRDDEIQNHRAAVVGFLRAMIRAGKDYDAAFQQIGADGKPVRGKGADDILALVSKYTDQPVNVVSAAMTYIEPECSLPEAQVAQQISNWQALGMVDPSVKAADVMDLGPLNDALAPKS
ncbi:MAG: hypothetical protein GC186_08520 [Rhodobacteraceae bacterium]|nr:hypothetical protein [Paracoccaceae bacterium]